MAKASPKASRADPSVDWATATEQQVLDAALPLAAREGWTSRLATMAGKACGLSAGETELLLPQG
ncbi:MAG TPA: COQ9 family protein, partial [Phenylobacterium sp.]|nr:COQ9 family protein [Phenylobacterium sp.]